MQVKLTESKRIKITPRFIKLTLTRVIFVRRDRVWRGDKALEQKAA